MKHHWVIRFKWHYKKFESVDENGTITNKMQLPDERVECEFEDWNLKGSHQLYIYRQWNKKVV